MELRRRFSLTSLSAPHRNLFAYLILFATMAMWASAFSGIRYMLEFLSPMSFTVLRMLIAAATMLVVGVACGVKMPRREDLPSIVSAAVLGFAGYHLLLNLGSTYVSAGQASFIIATTPVWTALLAARFLRETLTMRVVGGLGVSLLGVSIISLAGEGVSVSVGVIFVLLAALCDAVYTILSKSLLERYRPIDFAVHATLIGCLPLLMYMPWAWSEVAALSPTAWWVVIYLGVVPVSLGYWLHNVALSVLSATRTSQMMLLVPVMAAAMAWAWLSEEPEIQMLVGGPIILLGVLLGHLQRREGGRRS